MIDGLSNCLMVILNFATLMLSIPMVMVGKVMGKTGNTASECLNFLEDPIIVIGIFIMVISLAGLIGLCCRVTCLLQLYLIILMLLIIIFSFFSIFAFIITNDSAAKFIDQIGLGDHSNWLNNRVSKPDNWKRITHCLIQHKVCDSFNSEPNPNQNYENWLRLHKAPLKVGCCKPSNECGFTYVRPMVWTTPPNFEKTKAKGDCNAWNNDPKGLCFDCETCKSGMVYSLKYAWSWMSIINFAFIVFLNIVHSVAFCAYDNVRRELYFRRGYNMWM